MRKLCRTIAAMPVHLPSLNGLCAFEAAARHGSFARAAADLHVTKSAVSHRIRRLEEQLGVPLFTRRTRGLVLTPEGQAYLPDVRAAFANLRAATVDLLRPQRGHILKVSATPTLAAKWLVPRLAGFNAEHPGIDVRINTSMRLVDFAREGMDMAIRYGRGVWPGLRTDRLPMTDEFFPVCSPALLRGPVPLRAPGDLASHTLLYVDYERIEWRLWLDAAGVLPEVTRNLTRRGLTFDDAYMALQAAVGGLGVALGYGPYVEADIAAGRLVAPFDVSLPSSAGFDAYVVCPEAMARERDISVFRDWLLTSADVARSGALRHDRLTPFRPAPACAAAPPPPASRHTGP
jgi:LysR family glycine cleavage system transcriptional activator